ncbi:hypothetical protein E2C01_078784 [Portunus trituberculatus]|uniref:Uncharacterized protein n=1 Tax=Portunus trituberculatus TaxID=210409 RepID=A0A5B7ITQ8_PORTR|nr:hypothetical protein [Portunus trituberculatus]
MNMKTRHVTDGVTSIFMGVKRSNCLENPASCFCGLGKPL